MKLLNENMGIDYFDILNLLKEKSIYRLSIKDYNGNMICDISKFKIIKPTSSLIWFKGNQDDYKILLEKININTVIIDNILETGATVVTVILKTKISYILFFSNKD